MKQMNIATTFIVLLLTIEYAPGFKLANYNTYQGLNPFASQLIQPQLTQIATSNVDVFCMQELNLVNSLIGYRDQLKQLGYTYSFGYIDIVKQLAPENLELPRISCTPVQYAILTSNCSKTLCGNLYNNGHPSEYGVCMATVEKLGLCPGFSQITFNECIGCIAMASSILGQALGSPPTINEAAGWCASPTSPSSSDTNLYFNLTDGAYIFSKNQIINTWSYILPSWLFFQRRLNIAQINVCSETRKNPKSDCRDSILVGCTHLEATDFINDENIVQNPLDPSLQSISSHIGLNRKQTEYIVNNVFNDNILYTLGIDDNEADNIYGVFLMGDTNNGQLFDRCDVQNLYPSDDCIDNNDQQIENIFNLFKNQRLIDAPDIKYTPKSISQNIVPLCTQCTDPNADDYNILITIDDDTFIYDPNFPTDLDHILIQDGYCNNFKAKSFNRIFMDNIVNLTALGFNQLTPASDHYGVALQIEFKKDKGGDRKSVV